MRRLIFIVLLISFSHGLRAEPIKCNSPTVRRTLLEVILPAQLQQNVDSFSVVDVTTVARKPAETNVLVCQAFVVFKPTTPNANQVRTPIRYSVLPVDSDPSRGSVSVTQSEASRFYYELNARLGQEVYRAQQEKFGCNTPSDCSLREMQSRGYSMEKYPITCDFPEIKSAIISWVQERYPNRSADQIQITSIRPAPKLDRYYADRRSDMYGKGITCEANVSFPPIQYQQGRNRQIGGLKIGSINVDWADARIGKMNVNISNVSQVSERP